MSHAKTINATFSLPAEVYELLQHLVKKGNLSQFVSKAIERSLQDEQRTLRQAYLQSNQDEQVKQELGEWDSIGAEAWPHE